MVAKQAMKQIDDKVFMSDSSNWPMWPYLPIKRCSEISSLETGVLWHYKNEKEPTKVEVFIVNIFNLPKTVEEFMTKKKYTYDNIEALLADGWIVD